MAGDDNDTFLVKRSTMIPLASAARANVKSSRLLSPTETHSFDFFVIGLSVCCQTVGVTSCAYTPVLDRSIGMSARLKHVTMDARLRDEDNNPLTLTLVDLGIIPSATQGFLAAVTLMAILVAIAAVASQVTRQSLGFILRAIFIVHRSTFGMDRFMWSSGTEHTPVLEYVSAF